MSLLVHADLAVNLHSREVHRGGRLIGLTVREFALLECLLRRPGRAWTRTQLYEQIWGYHFDPGTNVVDVAIQRLRRKLEEGADIPLIETVRGAGYRLRALP